MAKKNGNGSLGRKVKMSQPVAIPWDLAIDLVAAKVVKPPSVPKMEPMEKWIVAGGRSFSVSHEDGLTVVTITAPGIDGEATFEGVGETLPLATAKAIQKLWQATPQPDPDGKDLPLFRGNGGVASVAEMELPRDISEIDPEGGAEYARIEAAEEAREDDLEGVFIGEAQPIGPDAADPAPNEWRFLFVVDPKDVKRWKKEAPWCDGAEIVEWEEGDESNDRGWYLDPGYSYDPKSGEIRVAGAELVVWSRDAVGAAV